MEEPVYVPDPPEAEGPATFLSQATWPAIFPAYRARLITLLLAAGKVNRSRSCTRIKNFQSINQSFIL